ncbi:hypothetical protein HBI56_185190 [Parastagonospora nodorum]|uniref:RRM domain-containing protein n=2 Tax=Phaeosphaeria nodorum (strain SN15 / ATCC MYA-4574 / FGSC 10173) TaxID=321614 RepID=A0A7U2I7H4_PHANO|nr:hypothetical protein SNOG_14285 [Parastagonospora nodorum SN15]KAH3907357.1 hypothetical protein HBH56_193650 [Parastagonospora nodorum]EAT78522.2 hypothetical protein SNOG_14285 [Parastagonospora nodorum SN15]KAH3937964.1 hypothetical protein HBH54_008310 [Parastagonospora nodorum]KAH3938786.1 hypothetical protein HBH53_246070 [Parastagonospora nodorum]KAH3966560.1 hypothetical protein HBH52_197270 [Parastagonospora nodorum]
MSVRRTAPKLLASRSVHLRIVPRPANLSESREIFRVLQRFGELSMYKSLRFEYHNPADNIALVIFRDANAAQKALDASPIRFALDKVVDPNDEDHLLELRSQDNAEDTHETTPATQSGIDEILRPSVLTTRASPPASPPPKPLTPPPMPFESPSAPPQTRTKWFQVTVDRSRAVHQDYVERQPFWKQFQPMKSMAQEDLAKQVPHSGLSDVSKRPMNQHRTPVRVLKTMNEYVEYRMPSLKGMFEGSDNEKRFTQRKEI